MLWYCYNFVLNQIKECHEKCKDCKNSLSDSCTSCYYGQILIDSKCLTSCPPGYYFSNQISNCEKCKPECELCNSENECDSCSEGYYLQNKKQCLNSCPYGFYKNELSRECTKCSEGCIACFGPSNKNCIYCNHLKGYGFLSPNSRECVTVLCKDGEFSEFVNNQLICSKCYETCKTCINGRKDGCLECNKGFMPFKKKFDQYLTERISFECSTCEENMVGYFTDDNGNCKGIFIISKSNRNLWRWA